MWIIASSKFLKFAGDDKARKVGLQSRWSGWQLCDYAHARHRPWSSFRREKSGHCSNGSIVRPLNMLKSREDALLMKLYCK